MNFFKKKLREQGISEEDLEEALEREKKKAEKILRDKEKTQKLIDSVLKLCDKLSRLPVIGKVFRELPLACMMVSDYIHGEYREVPLATIITLTAAFAYFISPLNLIPNVVPVVGCLDDALVFRLALQAARNDLEAYIEWKMRQQEYSDEN